uniref:Uncharacterized protein n=1 Tax=Ditylenchus dipsaci TaxID=166011 RepID=A0A915EI42_9BILA
MMDSLNHRNADYIQDISMEISSAFYPPPMIVLPCIPLPPLCRYKFDFKTEHEMIQKYREDQLRIKQIAEAKERAEAESGKEREELMTASEQTASDSPCSSCSTPPSAESSSSSQNTRPSDHGTAQTKASSQLEPSKSNKEIRKLQRFEEFEVASSVFDIVELRSLDDRKELEKLLNGL